MPFLGKKEAREELCLLERIPFRWNSRRVRSSWRIPGG